jgi:hypothetical protein
VYQITQSQKKGKTNVLQKEKEVTLMEYICEKNIVDWESNHIDIIRIESCRNYLGKSDSFQEQHT